MVTMTYTVVLQELQIGENNKMSRILVTGHTGQLGKALMQAFPNHDLIGVSKVQCDITNSNQVMDTFTQVNPSIVMHTAALTDVEYCAQNPEEAIRVNKGGTENIILACKKIKATLLYI